MSPAQVAPPGAAPVTEIRPLTGLRGAFAVFVVLYHYLGDGQFTNPLATFFNHAYMSVDVFFVISGFVLTLNHRHLFESGWSSAAFRKFVGRRIARIYPLYFVTMLVGLLFLLIGWQPGWGVYATPAPLSAVIASNLIMVQTWGIATSLDLPAWSISAEWAAYLLFPIILVPAMFGRVRTAWISAGLCALALALLCIAPRVYHTANHAEFLNMYQPRFGLPLVRCIAEFTLGVLAFRVWLTPWAKALASNRWITPSLCVLFAALMAIRRTDVALALLLPLLIVGFTSMNHLPGRFLGSRQLEYLGTLSYSIYLIHALFAGLIVWIHAHLHAAGVAHAHSYAALVAMCLTFPLAALAYHTIEAPGRTWMRKFLDGGRATTTRALGEPSVTRAH